MKVVEDFESVAERDKEIQEWNAQNFPKVLPGYSGRRLLGRSTEEACKEEEEKEEHGEGRIRNGIAQKVVEGIKGAAQRTVGQRVKRNWDSSCRKQKTGKRRARWKGNGLRMRSWRRFWNEERGKEAP